MVVERVPINVASVYDIFHSDFVQGAFFQKFRKRIYD